jgi:DNA-binding response OmpR family regulator
MSKCKIALIEDEKDLADIYSMKLQMDGIDTVIINDSTKAVEVLKNEKPILALLDIMMPDLNGFELFEKIKAESDLQDIKIYIWSNLTQQKDKELATKMKVDGYIIKSDYTPASLSEKIKEILAIK